MPNTSDNQAALQNFAKKNNYKLYMTSSKNGTNVNELFGEIDRHCHEKHQKEQLEAALTHKAFLTIAVSYLNSHGLNKSVQSKAIATFIQNFISNKKKAAANEVKDSDGKIDLLEDQDQALSDEDKFQLYNILKPYMESCQGKTFHGNILALFNQLEKSVKEKNPVYRENNSATIKKNLSQVLQFIAQAHQDRLSFRKSDESNQLAKDIIGKNETALLSSYTACISRESSHRLKNTIAFLKDDVEFCFKPTISNA